MSAPGASRTVCAQGCDFLSVSAATGNFKAHRFYEDMNFVPRPVTGMRFLQRLG